MLSPGRWNVGEWQVKVADVAGLEARGGMNSWLENPTGSRSRKHEDHTDLSARKHRLNKADYGTRCLSLGRLALMCVPLQVSYCRDEYGSLYCRSWWARWGPAGNAQMKAPPHMPRCQTRQNEHKRGGGQSGAWRSGKGSRKSRNPDRTMAVHLWKSPFFLNGLLCPLRNIVIWER